MNKNRVSIAGMLGIIAFCGAWLAAVRSGATWVTTVAAAILTIAFLSASVGLIMLRGYERAFRLGFVVVGVGFSLEFNKPWLGHHFGQTTVDLVQEWGGALFPAAPLPSENNGSVVQNDAYHAINEANHTGMPGPDMATPPPIDPMAGFRARQADEKGEQRRNLKISNFAEFVWISINLIVATFGGLVVLLMAARTHRISIASNTPHADPSAS